MSYRGRRGAAFALTILAIGALAGCAASEEGSEVVAPPTVAGAEPSVVTRTVEVYFADAPEPTSVCTASCDWIHFKVEGFEPGTLTASAKQDKEGGFPDRTIEIGSDGRGDSNDNYWFTGFGEEVCVTVDGVQGCATPP